MQMSFLWDWEVDQSFPVLRPPLTKTSSIYIKPELKCRSSLNNVIFAASAVRNPEMASETEEEAMEVLSSETAVAVVAMDSSNAI